jgi:hypothetical protein
MLRPIVLLWSMRDIPRCASGQGAWLDSRFHGSGEADMARWWLGTVVLAVGVAVSPATAQAPYGQGGQPLMPEPVPLSCAPQGPALPQAALPSPGGGPGGDSPTSLRSDLPNAWSEDIPTDPPAVYFGIGYLAMQRSRLEHAPTAFLDTISGGVDTGLPPQPGAPAVGDFHDIDPRFQSGVKVTLGYHCDTHAWEASGFYLFQSTSTRLYANPGSLNAPFNVNGSFSNFPVGFEGDNGMWLQADQIATRLQTALGSAELNYRWWLGTDSNFSYSLGVRYFDVYDKFSYYTGDDDLTVRDVNGNPNPLLQATYSATAHNHIAAPQLGIEWNKAACTWLAFSVVAKGAWGADFYDIDTHLRRGDGFEGFHGRHSETQFAHAYEVGAFFDFHIMDNMRLRAGYNLLWLINIAEGAEVFDFNLANQQGTNNTHGDMFFHGPSVELNILF